MEDKLEQGGYTAKKKFTKSCLVFQLCFFSPSDVYTSLPESIQYVSDSLLIGWTEKKKDPKTIGRCVHMDPNGSDPGGMCQFTQNQTPETNVRIKMKIK